MVQLAKALRVNVIVTVSSKLQCFISSGKLFYFIFLILYVLMDIYHDHQVATSLSFVGDLELMHALVSITRTKKMASVKG